MSIRTRFGASLVFLLSVLIIGTGILTLELQQSEAAAFESFDKPQDSKSREAREREEREKKERHLKEIATRGRMGVGISYRRQG